MLRDKFRILYVSDLDLSRDTGPAINEREFLISLSERLGSSLAAVTGRVPADEDFGSSLIYQVYASGGSDVPQIGLKHLVSSHRLASVVGRVAQSFLPTLVVTRLRPFPIAQVEVGRKLDCPIVVKTMGLGVLLERTPRTSSVIKSANRLILDWFIDRNVAMIDVCTREIERSLRDRFDGSTRIEIVDNATNTNRFQPRARHEGMVERLGVRDRWPIIGIVSARIVERGGRMILNAAPLIIERYPDARILIIGGDERLSDLIDEVHSRGLSEHIRVAGHMPYKSLPNVMSLLDVAIAYDDPFHTKLVGNASQKVRQFVACGIPVIASNVGNAFLEEADLGSLVDFNETTAVIEAIDLWSSRVRSPRLRSQHQDRAFDYARINLSVAETTTRRLELWGEVL